jgi:hypothetical protein
MDENFWEKLTHYRDQLGTQQPWFASWYLYLAVDILIILPCFSEENTVGHMCAVGHTQWQKAPGGLIN